MGDPRTRVSFFVPKKDLKFGFVELFETNKQIEFVGTGVLDGPQIT